MISYNNVAFLYQILGLTLLEDHANMSLSKFCHHHLHGSDSSAKIQFPFFFGGGGKKDESAANQHRVIG